MRATYLYNGKKITKKAAVELVGKERLEKMVKESEETFREDPYIENDYMAKDGILTIRF